VNRKRLSRLLKSGARVTLLGAFVALLVVVGWACSAGKFRQPVGPFADLAPGRLPGRSCLDGLVERSGIWVAR
jgi:hypothetical protein